MPAKRDDISELLTQHHKITPNPKLHPLKVNLAVQLNTSFSKRVLQDNAMQKRYNNHNNNNRGRFITVFGKAKRVSKTLFSDKYLFVTNVIISASLSGVGDAIEQKRQIVDSKEEENKFDLVRSRNMCLSGITVGILSHKWYRWLDGKYPGRSLDVVKTKVLLDTLVFSPMQICTFFSTMGILEKSKVNEVRAEIYEKGRVLYLFEWMVWAPLQVVNFYFLSAKYRVLFDNSFSLIYDIFVSYVKFDRSLEESPKPGKPRTSSDIRMS